MSTPDPAPNARAWLTPGPESPWRIDDDGETLVWRDGATVAFRAEIEAVLRRVAGTLGIVPPFPAVVLLCAAARSPGRALRAERWDEVREGFERATPWLFARVAAVKEVTETADALRAIAALPDAFFGRPDALPLLVEAVLAEAGLTRAPEAARRFIEEFDARPTPGTASDDAGAAAHRAVAWGEALAALRRGLPRFDPAALVRRAGTGVECDVVAADVSLPETEDLRSLLGRLRDDPDFGAVARLSIDAGAAVRLPRLARAAEELPVGGVSDIESRGSPERLLVSELAHDGLTLAVRVATGQALYLRREPPPRGRRSVRCVLLDSGIRLWGVGRVFATACGLALAATAEWGVSVRVRRAAAAATEAVDLRTREGIAAHLAALRPETSPVLAMPAFLRESGDVGDDTEVCIVTHEDALAEPAFRESLVRAGRALHVVSVDAAGNLVVRTFGFAGGAVVRRAKLDLGAVLASPGCSADGGPRRGARDPSPQDEHLPRILRMPALPIRVPHVWRNSEFCGAAEFGDAAVTPDRRLVLWTDTKLGPVELSDSLPPGRFLGLGSPVEGVVLAAFGGGSVPVRLVHADLHEGWTETHELVVGREAPRTAVFLDDAVGFVLDSGRVVVAVIGSSAAATELRWPVRHAGGRFFVSRDTADAWHVLVPAADGAKFEALKVPVWMRGHIVRLFDRHGVDGPWAVLSGPPRVASLATGEVIALPTAWIVEPVTVTAISSDGHRLTFTRKGGWTSIHLRDTAVLSGARDLPVYGPDVRWIERIVGHTSPAQLRRKFRSISIDGDGRLCLERFRVAVGAGGREMVLAAGAAFSAQDFRQLRSFSHRPHPGRRWSLRDAHWHDGSRAFLDSRGLLHLVSSDAALPEITLVLANGPLAAWCSDGRTHGPEMFLGSPGDLSADEMLRRITGFAERLR